MKYMLVMFGDESWEDHSPEETQAEMKAWDEFTSALVEAGAMVSGEGLAPSATARTVRFGDEHVITDGPYAETKEQLGGFYVIDVPDLDAAVEWAQRLPLSGGAVEVRPVMDYEAAGSTEKANAEAAS